MTPPWIEVAFFLDVNLIDLFSQVSDPVQHADGMTKYTSYRVDVRPPPDTGNEIVPSNLPVSTVLRRYSDFLWLYERLHIERPGAVVPPLPEKQPVGRFSPEFVEDRRIHLERFLRRVAVHPELADCSCLDTFLRADDITFQHAKAIKITSNNSMSSSMAGSSFLQTQQQQQQAFLQPAKNEGIKRWFKEAKTSISGDLVKSPDDDLFDEISRYITGLDNQMKNVQIQASGLVRKGKEISNGLFEFGLAFNLLGQTEGDALGNALSSMGGAADKLSVLAAEQAEKELAEFEEPLNDYIKTVHAVKLALQRRHEKRLTYSTCLADVESKTQQLYKLRSQIGSEAKAYSVEMSLRRAQEAADLARDDFCATSQRVLREVDRFKREKAEDMRRTVLDYINIQVEYNKRMEEIWGSLIPELENVSMEQQQHHHPSMTSPAASTNTTPQNRVAPVSPETTSNLQQHQQTVYGFGHAQVPHFESQHHSQYHHQPQQQPPAPIMGDPMISVQYRETPGPI
jgi:sorting nexin-1/2